ncbi:MAG: YwaF family protein [Clostridia bacterium]|nr:YwaF family protein [Clostridia bacterium]
MFWGEVLNFLDSSMTTPTSYGVFHLVSFALSILIGVWLCIRFKDSERYAKRIVLITAIIVTVFEIYKQINYTFTYDGTAITADYQWYAFPWQFCSTPMYVGLLAGLTRGKVHESLCAYLATFAVFAGVCVMFYPNDVFISTIGINIQTMICHGSMLSIGIYLLASGYVKLEHKTILKAVPVFAIAVAVAVVLNELAHATGLLATEDFNMFFVSPYCDPHLPVYSIVQQHVAFPWCLILYILGFSVAAYLMLLIAMGVKAIVNTRAANKKQEITIK